VQRPLWGSTSTKNPDYPDTLYLDTLIGPHTVNTVPPETLEAFLDHGTAARTVDADVEQARQQLAQLADLGIDLDSITEQLMGEGVDSFADSFDELMSGIAGKVAAIAGGDGNQTRERTDFFTVPSRAG
jgi:transaldolase